MNLKAALLTLLSFFLAGSLAWSNNANTSLQALSDPAPAIETSDLIATPTPAKKPHLRVTKPKKDSLPTTIQTKAEELDLTPEESIALQMALTAYSDAKMSEDQKRLNKAVLDIRQLLLRLNDRGIKAKIDILRANDRELKDFLANLTSPNPAVSQNSDLVKPDQQRTADVRGTIDRCLVLALVACSFVTEDVRAPRRPVIFSPPAIESTITGDPPETGNR